MGKKYNYREVEKGKYVTKEFAEKNPKTTVRETIKTKK
jgi:hypothetical protein